MVRNLSGKKQRLYLVLREPSRPINSLTGHSCTFKVVKLPRSTRGCKEETPQSNKRSSCNNPKHSIPAKFTSCGACHLTISVSDVVAPSKLLNLGAPSILRCPNLLNPAKPCRKVAPQHPSSFSDCNCCMVLSGCKLLKLKTGGPPSSFSMRPRCKHVSPVSADSGEGSPEASINRSRCLKLLRLASGAHGSSAVTSWQLRVRAVRFETGENAQAPQNQQAPRSQCIETAGPANLLQEPECSD